MNSGHLSLPRIRKAHALAQKGSSDLVHALTDLDPSYPSVTEASLEAAAENYEKAARNLRDAIAIARAQSI